MVRARGHEGLLSSALVLLLAFLFIGLSASGSRLALGQTGTVTGIGPWTQQDNYGSTTTSGGIMILGVSCVYYNGYIYCIGGQNLQKLSNSDISDVFYAPVSASGTIGGWVETIDYGASSGTTGSGGIGAEWPSCVQYSGYVYCVGGATNSGTTSDVFYAQLATSGVGPWKETIDYGASSGTTGSGGVTGFQHSCVADSGYIYCVGDGFGTSKVYYAQLSTNGVGPWSETTDYGAKSGKAGSGGINIASTVCVDSNATIFCVGGTVSYKPISNVFYAPLDSSGVGAWTETTDYGASSGNSGSGGTPIYGPACVVYLSTLICMAGNTSGNTPANTVYYAQDPVDLVWIQTGPSAWFGYWEFCTVPDSPHVVCVGGGSNIGTSGTIQTPGTIGSSTTTTTPVISPSTTVVESTTSATTTSSLTTAVSSSSQTSESTTGVATPPASSSNGSLLWVGIVVALLIVGALGFLFWTRSKKPKVPPVTTEKTPPPKETPTGTTPPDVGPCCGPDITDNVLAGMLKLMRDFFSWDRDTQGTEFGYLTAMTGEPSYNNAWDIEELMPSDGRRAPWEFSKTPVTYKTAKEGYMRTLAPYENRCMKPKDPCDPSVMFLKNCHHPQVVNYVEWGVLTRLKEWYDATEGVEEAMAEMRRTGIAKEIPPPSVTHSSYEGTAYSDFHKLRSNTVPGMKDPHYQDQVAMCNAGWRLAEDYITRKNQGRLPYKLSEVNQFALQAVLETYEDKSRPTAKCKEGCGKYSPPNAFRYIFGDKQPLRAGLVSDY